MSSSDKALMLFRRFLVLGLFLCRGIAAAQAQSESPDVHIQPRVHSTPGQGLSNGYVDMIRKHVDLVLVPVTITDEMQRIVVGLDKKNFQVYEGKDPQDVKHFSSEDAPASLGVILDMSSSMASKLERAREAVVELLKASNPQDEVFLITFADTPQVVQDFSPAVEDIQQKLLFTRPHGRTALLDAIYLGLGKMEEAKYPRRALLVISDGGDNHSRYTEGEVKSPVKEADVPIYSVGIFDREFRTREELLGPELLNEISGVTGAQCYTLDNPNDLPIVARHIGIRLRHQYVLGYSPSNSKDDGKWRKIKVRLTLLPKGLSPLRVYAKTGYYGRSQAR